MAGFDETPEGREKMLERYREILANQNKPARLPKPVPKSIPKKRGRPAKEESNT